ncbi:MAG: TIGR00725 family protein [Deltaproteobacteria bacterium]|nr:TIGR00725 family protein [Deltaproteobacteria bacterium]
MVGKRRIGVIGNSLCSEETVTLAEHVGREIARRGAILICGGLTGVMEGAARGAKQANGLTVGILPGDGVKEANPYIDIPIPTGLGPARNILVVRSSEVIIAIHGEYGTLSEIAHALQLRIPIVGLQTWDVSEDIIKASNSLDAVNKAFTILKKK